MEYFIAFLEGIITFISPCLLPMLPLYISYFAGGEIEGKRTRIIKNALGFVFGFSIIFIILGVFAGTVGQLLSEHQTMVNIVSGLVVLIFGLNFIGILRIPLLNKSLKLKANTNNLGFISSFIFGVIFSVGWTPCVGAFLGSALMLVSQQGSIVKGTLMMICYSVGLGIPFIATALLIDKLKSTFEFIKRNYRIINLISGIMLIFVGILMMSGYMNWLLSLITI
ncbi:cytochrome c biogenesis protein CcdA [Lachnospiraceae bacterium OttesenSCG-928-D06]|nr:cytochrome c biogenesis protein CcdA [Lachnospiraceae bacterium OttesenSCG-928-D06]